MSPTLQTAITILVIVVTIVLVVSLLINLLPFIIIGVVMFVVYRFFKAKVLNKQGVASEEKVTPKEKKSEKKLELDEVTDVNFKKK
jgi:uncharacterized membrane protein